jgi:dipeptidyl aminopeptidase/acylaminoacyl peptidase
MAEGILYKPEDFNPQKKYPVIFYFYERMTPGLCAFPEFDLCDGPINIPWFVSHGYLVVCPDIEFTMGDPGYGPLNYVISAAKMMAKKPWVDAKRMGIQGHSFVGYEVNYLITRSNLFATIRCMVLLPAPDLNLLN